MGQNPARSRVTAGSRRQNAGEISGGLREADWKEALTVHAVKSFFDWQTQSNGCQIGLHGGYEITLIC